MARGLERLEFFVGRFDRLRLRARDAARLIRPARRRSVGSPFGGLGMRGLRLRDLLLSQGAIGFCFARGV